MSATADKSFTPTDHFLHKKCNKRRLFSVSYWKRFAKVNVVLKERGQHKKYNTKYPLLFDIYCIYHTYSLICSVLNGGNIMVHLHVPFLSPSPMIVTVKFTYILFQLLPIHDCQQQQRRIKPFLKLSKFKTFYFMADFPFPNLGKITISESQKWHHQHLKLHVLVFLKMVQCIIYLSQ